MAPLVPAVVDTSFAAPEIDRAAGEFRADILEHADVIVEIAG
jgi:hypothetical protein